MGSVLPPDNHVHTQWSWDAPAEASMVRSCEQALALGVPAVAFTDHLDFTTGTDGDRVTAEHIEPRPYARMHLLDVPGYLAMVDECRERYPDLRILTGAEIGEAHLWAASAQAVVARAGFERILGSLHAIPFDGKLTASDELFRRMPADQVMRLYFAELLRLVEGSDIFQVLAHLDFPRRMWPQTAGPYEELAFEAEYRAVLRALAASACSQLRTIDASRGASHDHSVCTWLSTGGDQPSLAGACCCTGGTAGSVLLVSGLLLRP